LLAVARELTAARLVTKEVKKTVKYVVASFNVERMIESYELGYQKVKDKSS
jgi:hypothetical protein